MFTLVTGVRPMKVRFLNRFLRLSDKRLLTILIKKKIEEDKSQGAFLTDQGKQDKTLMVLKISVLSRICNCCPVLCEDIVVSVKKFNHQTVPRFKKFK